MITKLNKYELSYLLLTQINNMLAVDRGGCCTNYVDKAVSMALEKVEYCFSFVSNKYYKKDGDVYFNPFHTSQNVVFLYHISNIMWKDLENQELAEKIYYLNKILNSVDILYDVELPNIFCCDHPVGTVIGRAKYSDFFFFSQGCTVGNNKLIYPTIGKNVWMCAGSRIIGKCNVGDDCVISMNSALKDTDVSSNSIVFENGDIKEGIDSFSPFMWWEKT